MKKIFTIFVVLTVLSVFCLPVLAQMRQPNECCKTRTKLIIKDTAAGGTGTVTIEKNTWIGPVANTSFCDANGDGTDEDAITGYKAIDMWGMLCLLDTIFFITNWLFYILTIIVSVMIIYGGFILLTAQGEPAKVGKGKGIVTFAIIGLAVALVAKIIPSVVKFIMGV